MKVILHGALRHVAVLSILIVCRITGQFLPFLLYDGPVTWQCGGEIGNHSHAR
jgi:hypothetical protein